MAFGTTATVITISTSGQTVTADFGGNYIRASSIRGSITSGATGIVARVSLTGISTASGTSDTSGDFEFTGLRSGDYTVTVSDTLRPVRLRSWDEGSRLGGRGVPSWEAALGGRG